MDFTDCAIDYAEKAQSSKKHGKWSRLACLRFLNDLERAESSDCKFYFDDSEAIKACSFAQKMPHVEGIWDSPYIKLHESMVFFYANLYGFRKVTNGTRRFTSALWSSGRKNAKSTGLGAPIGLYNQFEENEPGAQIVSAAPTGDQAAIIFNVAKRMVEKMPDFQDWYGAKAYARTIAGFGNGSVFKYINAKASTQDGLNPSTVLVDEVHGHKTHDLINVLKSAAGARRSPLFLFVTTEGYVQIDSPWPEMRKMAQQLLEGAIEADHFLALMFAIDDKDDEYDPNVWIKANPLMEVNPILKEEIEKEAIEAKLMPGKAAEFRVKRCNRSSASSDSFVDIHKFNQGSKNKTLQELKGLPCWFGLDVSSTRDLTSLRGLWLDHDGQYYTHGWRFAPEEGTYNKTVTGASRYQSWTETGHLILTPGRTVNQQIIEDLIVELYEEYQPIEIAADEWNARELIRRLDEREIDISIFVQGGRSYHPAVKKFEEVYINGQLNHGNDPILKWCAANLVVIYNDNMNMHPSKKKSADKIDDVIALIMCFGKASEFKQVSSFDEIMSRTLSIEL